MCYWYVYCSQFHFVLNVAVGGTNGFIPDGCINRDGHRNAQKPWSNGDSYTVAMNKFYNSRNQWKPTWDSEGDNLAMQVDYIRVYQRNQWTTSVDSLYIAIYSYSQ